MTIFKRISRAFIAVGCATALGLGIPAVANASQAQTVTRTPAAGRFAGHATAYQNKVIAYFTARDPGGIRVSASEIRWANGVILKVMPSATAARKKSGRPDAFESCNAGYFCASPNAYPSFWWALPNEILYGKVYFYPWGDCSFSGGYGCDKGLHAYANNTGQRIWLEQDINSGNEFCITNRTYSLDFQGANSLDYWIYFSNNPNAC